MGRYRMSPGKEEIVGEGSSSICRRAVCLQTGEHVAVKVYKKNSNRDSSRHEEINMLKFKRQISVLKELTKAFQAPADQKFWSAQLENMKPSRLFMQLLDFSRDANGNPGLDPRDSTLYVVTELAQYSLKDYFASRRDHNKALPWEAVRNVTKALILVVAGLHSKDLVHLDLKPENIMMFNGRLKLIDVDGCVRAGTEISIQDPSISFSPCYCAPEWVRFLLEETPSTIAVSTALDAWSLGMTLCELVTLDAVLKPTYARFVKNAQGSAEGGFLFMDWLSNMNQVHLPKSVEKFDPDFHDLLVNWLLLADPKSRMSCAQCLSHPFTAATVERKTMNGSQITKHLTEESHLPLSDMAAVKPRSIAEDHSSAPVHKGALFRLDLGGDLDNPLHWRRLDMWITTNGSFCYFSIKDSKRLVLLDAPKLVGSRIEVCQSAVRHFAFSVQPRSDDDRGAGDVLPGTADNREVAYCFACESEEELKSWMEMLSSVAVNMGALVTTMRLGFSMQEDLDRFRLQVKNRRMSIDDTEIERFAPVFKGTLWKVKAEGDRRKAGDWFEREMWISKNGSLVYWSKKEGRQLVYYTADDIMQASFVLIPNAETFQPWAFAIQLPMVGGMEFAPGEFAAESEELRQQWLTELARCKAELH